MSAAEKMKPALSFKLIVESGPHAGQVFHMSKESFTIGRSPENDIILFNDTQVSRQHVKIMRVENEIEIFNLSQKNELIINAENVRKWKLLNGNQFTIGDSLITVNFDLGVSVIAIKPQLKAQNNIQNKNAEPHLEMRSLIQPKKEITQKPSSAPKEYIQNVKRDYPKQNNQNNEIKQQIQLNSNLNANNYIHVNKSKDEEKKKKIIFYSILIGLGFILYFWLAGSDEVKIKNTEQAKPLFQSDEDYLVKLNSTTEKELSEKRKEQLEVKNSYNFQRVQENFQKGIRDYNLGQYSRAIEYFLTVLNLDSNHQLARRYLFLSQVRLQEVLNSKLTLGERYYQSHNFKMCEAMFNQVLAMLQSKSDDANYVRAQDMVNKCRLASEGIR